MGSKHCYPKPASIDLGSEHTAYSCQIQNTLLARVAEIVLIVNVMKMAYPDKYFISENLAVAVDQGPY